MRILILLLFMATPVWAATPTYVASSQQCSFSGSGTVTISAVPVGAGQSLVMSANINTGGATTISSATFNTTENFTELADVHNGSGIRATLLRLLAPTATTANVVITFNNTIDAIVCVSRYTNVASYGTAATGSGTSGTPTVTCSSATGELVVDMTAQNYTEAIGAVGAGQTSEGVVDDGNNLQLANSYQSGAASVVMDWTNSLNQWASSCVSLIGASANRSTLTLLGVQ